MPIAAAVHKSQMTKVGWSAGHSDEGLDWPSSKVSFERWSAGYLLDSKASSHCQHGGLSPIRDREFFDDLLN